MAILPDKVAEDETAIIAAIQLLLGGLTTTQKAKIVRQATLDDLVVSEIHGNDLVVLISALERVSSEISVAKNIVPDCTGIGTLAVIQLRSAVEKMDLSITTIDIWANKYIGLAKYHNNLKR